MKVRIVVPAKEPTGAKSRLSHVLSLDERRQLALAVFEHTLEVLNATGQEFLVVTDSDRMARLAEGWGALVLREDQAEGESSAVDLATARSVADGVDRQLVIPADLADPDPGEILALLDMPISAPGVILAPAVGDDGTNGIVSQPPDVMPFLFGGNSFLRHQAAARHRGAAVQTLRVPSLVLDLDTPEDLRSFLASGADTPASRLLRELGVPDRLHSPEVRFIGVPGLPEVREGDDLADLILSAADLEPGDVLVVAQKIVSKSEGRAVALAQVQPSEEALQLAERMGKDPALVHLILSESRRVVKAVWPPGRTEGLIVAEHRTGHVMANAGIDQSNVTDPGQALLLPVDSDASAARLSAALGVPVIVSDTFGRPWRKGLVNVAIGAAGLPPLRDLRGTRDSAGRKLEATVLASADELAAGAGLVMGKVARVPVVIVRGFVWEGEPGGARDLVRPEQEDAFR